MSNCFKIIRSSLAHFKTANGPKSSLAQTINEYESFRRWRKKFVGLRKIRWICGSRMRCTTDSIPIITSSPTCTPPPSKKSISFGCTCEGTSQVSKLFHVKPRTDKLVASPWYKMDKFRSYILRPSKASGPYNFFIQIKLHRLQPRSMASQSRMS